MNNVPRDQHVPFVDLHAQYLSIKTEIDAAIEAVIRESAFVRGPHVDAFEEAFADLVGVPNCVSCANGTDALYIALKSLDVAGGDEVITTAHSWISTSETITQAGAKVVFADTDKSHCVSPDQIETKITSRTRGIVVVHLFGLSADMGRIMEIARRHGLWVIEDCAQAHLAEYSKRQVGTFGDLATFSFYPGKNLGAMGDAGAIVTSDPQLASWCETFSRHGGKGVHAIEGVNSRMDGMQAAILNVKLKHLPEWTRQRRSIADAYESRLQGIGDISLPQRFVDRSHVYHLFVIRTQHRDQLRKHLIEHDIATQINYPCALPFLPAYDRLGHVAEDFPIAHASQGEILSLPLYPEMTLDQVDRVCACIRSYYSTLSSRAA